MKSYSSMGLSGEERGYTEKRIRAGEKPAPTIKRIFTEGKAGKPGRNRASQEYRQGGSNPPPSSQSTKMYSYREMLLSTMAALMFGFWVGVAAMWVILK